MFKIDERLFADSHALLKWQGCHVRLHKGAALPWVIIIPETTCTEFHDLPIEQQLHITQASRVIGGYFKQNLGSEKINFAAIGNVVEQLHIHVIGRHSKDPLWPDVVWGQELPKVHYSNMEIERFRTVFQHLLSGSK